MSKIGKKWVRGGEEDQFIIMAIKEGKVTKYSKPAQIKKLNPTMFVGFSTNVIRNHLNELKRSNGLYCKFNNKI